MCTQVNKFIGLLKFRMARENVFQKVLNRFHIVVGVVFYGLDAFCVSKGEIVHQSIQEIIGVTGQGESSLKRGLAAR
ncbi:MAG: hypothetical protein Ct9H300mP13_8510 [Gammaproteobacteria bacterium]|nr:MAG: hypothetical protein Ct9H300mP13_8510 [Gammaproteobacteria bacterium]